MIAARETGITFWGPLIFGVVATASDNPAVRQDALKQGQALLERGCVSHNYFWFYRDAIEVSLEMNDWDQADLYATALERYFRDEPTSWPSFVVARGRALAEFGRSRGPGATLAKIKQLHADATRLNMRSELARLDLIFRSVPE